ncbi:YciI family protein [Microbacterium rhizophilus]|uniref:YciI family protein n=1 Tax=Microbacterium rhizophilus TaxID=3138934 RepID=UPI0031F1125A
MRFLILLAGEDHFEKWDAADDATRDAAFAAYRAFAEAVARRGRIIEGDALSHPDTARTVRAGTPARVTEGPYAETVEQLGGFYLIDVPSWDDAVELAGLLPGDDHREVRRALGVGVV